MTTIIDSLIVTLGLDGSKFKQGSKESIEQFKKTKSEADRTAKEMEAKGKQAAQFFSKVRNEALMFFGVFTAGRGLKNFAADTLATAANLGRLSDNLQMSVEDLSSWQRASERAGGSAAGITAQLQESQQAVAKFNTGITDENMLWFYNLGGSEKAFKSAKDYLLARADIIAQTYKVDPGKAQLQASQMGISPEQFNLIKKGAAGVLELVAAQEKLSRFTRKQADDAAYLENKLRDLKDKLAVTGTTVLIALIPAFERLETKLERMADWVIEHKDDIARWIGDAVSAVEKFIAVADGAAQSVGGWKVVLAALVALKVVSMATDLIMLAGALLKVGGGLASIGAGAGALGILGKLGLLGVAGAAGYGVGTLISKQLEGTKAGDAIGEFVARTLASFGNQAAADAVRANTGRDDYPSASSRPKAAEKPTPGNVTDVAKKLMSMGWTKEQAAGIAGSFAQESGLDPNARNAKSGAYGVGQWLGSRVKDFEKWAGKPLQGSSLDDQLKFFNYETTSGNEKSAGRKLRAAKTAREAAEVHSKFYERPGEDEANVPRRQAIADQTLAQIMRQAAVESARMPVVAASQPSKNTQSAANNNNVETNINGPINIVTQATDADGIAQSVGTALTKYSYVSQANSGIL